MMEIEEAFVLNAILKCRAKDTESLIRKWGWFTEEDLKTINFRAPRNAISSEVYKKCQTLGLRQEIGDLDLLCMQVYSSYKKKWSVHKLKGGLLKTDLDPLELVERMTTILEADCLGDVFMNAKSFGGATWVRLYVRTAGAEFRPSEVVYFLTYPHTPIIICSTMKVKTQALVFAALLEVFECEEFMELQLSGLHLPSLADLALQQSSQGPASKYRDLACNENPLVRSKAPKKAEEKRKMNPRLRDESKQEKLSRQDKLDATFGTENQPVLEKLDYKLDLRFRGTTFAPGLKDRQELFRCRVKFEGESVLEGTKNLARTGHATLPLPRHLARVHSLAKNHFTIGEMLPSRKRSAPDREDRTK